MHNFLDNHPVARVAIACGGTGGHLFPGMAVGEQLVRRGCEVTLLISPKEVDQQAVKTASEMEVATLPAVGFDALQARWVLPSDSGNLIARPRSFSKPARRTRLWRWAVLPAPRPSWPGRAFGAKTFLHESNTIPGRANRWLARVVDGAYIYFPQAGDRMRHCKAEVIGMPVRSQFLEPIDPAAARMALGMKPEAPVVLIMGGSQGASKINELMLGAAPRLAQAGLQILHLTGARDFEKVQTAYAAQKSPAVVRAFLSEMDLALGAATVAVSRAGASSSAELAAMQLPAILIPYPVAADNHQFFNAQAFVQSGAARMIEQREATSESLAQSILELAQNPAARSAMQEALEKWHDPNAAEHMAERILQGCGLPAEVPNE